MSVYVNLCLCIIVEFLYVCMYVCMYVYVFFVFFICTCVYMLIFKEIHMIMYLFMHMCMAKSLVMLPILNSALLLCHIIILHIRIIQFQTKASFKTHV